MKLNVYRIYTENIGSCHCHRIVVAESWEDAITAVEMKIGVKVNAEEDVEEMGSFESGYVFVENVEYCG